MSQTEDRFYTRDQIVRTITELACHRFAVGASSDESQESVRCVLRELLPSGHGPWNEAAVREAARKGDRIIAERLIPALQDCAARDAIGCSCDWRPGTCDSHRVRCGVRT